MFILDKLLRPLKRKTYDVFIWYIVYLVLSIAKKRLESNFTIQPNSKSILFNTQYHWYHSWIDYSMAAALRYRGFDVKMIICDGLPYCEQESLTVKRPNCSTCYKNTKKRADLFGLSTIKIGDLITEAKINDFAEISYTDSLQSLKKYKYLNVDIGKFAFRNFTHYYKGVVEIEEEKDEIFRKCIESALIICETTNNLFKLNKFNKVVTPNGKFIQSGIAIELSESYHVDYYTWDMFSQNGAAIFSKNNIAHDQNIDNIWDEIELKPLRNNQIELVKIFFDMQSKSLNTPHKYYDEKVINDLSYINTELALNNKSKVVALFTNVEWDSTAMGLNLAYIDMFDWVSSIVEFAINEKTFDLIIRAHPGESKVPKHLKTQSQICERIIKKYKYLPKNIHLIKPESDLSSYALSKISDVVMVYTSTLGLEFALMGIKPWVAATPYYSGKGFTVDIKSHGEFINLIRTEDLNNKLNKKELEAAIKLAYVIKFRRLFKYPVFNNKGKFKLFDYKNLVDSEVDNAIQNTCDFIEDKRDYLDLGPSVVDH